MNVLDRAQSRMPKPWRTIVDWLVTIAVAVAFVLAFQAQVAKPYRIPTSSMEPTLHCAKPGAFCEGRFSDRVIANRLAFRFRDPERGEISSSRLPKRPSDAEGVTAARPSSSASSDSPRTGFGARRHHLHQRRAPHRALRRSFTTRSRERQLATRCARPLLRHGRQPYALLRLPHVGNGAHAA